jgi:hypothetical protein
MTILTPEDKSFDYLARQIAYYGVIDHREMAQIERVSTKVGTYKITMKDGRWTEIYLPALQNRFDWIKPPQHDWHEEEPMTISHNDRKDWGHGLNAPVPMWTEDQIRQALKGHGPSNDGCACSWVSGTKDVDAEFDIDHIVGLLKLFHLGAS